MNRLHCCYFKEQLVIGYTAIKTYYEYEKLNGKIMKWSTSIAQNQNAGK